VLVFPLFLVYQVGVLFTLPMLNGADFLTVFLFHNLGLSKGAYLAYTAAVAVAFAIAVAVLRRKQSFDPKPDRPGPGGKRDLRADDGVADPVCDDQRAARVARGWRAAIAEQGLGTRFVMSLGAGVWEETIFRLGIMTGVAVLLERVLGFGRWVAVAVALVRHRCCSLRCTTFRPTAIRCTSVYSCSARWPAASSASSTGSAASPSPSTPTPSTTSTCSCCASTHGPAPANSDPLALAPRTGRG
jgi:hypothetical protein